ncbi:hypothetical protein CUZ56_01486 [Saezia sanguinis]|uniref:Protein argonaute n=1 Tax=Saezia sanguinis TaxID=1965230 RepID=A0A433SDD4_9BURK|nr:hypothetical protein [Saezia sanguinis]RUS66696.1 hypothetical protein CUZ56_01486 [Saezia sanguinis]
MKLNHINEPRLQFAEGLHICPRRGIAAYGVYDRQSQTRRTHIHLGAVGTAQDIENFSALLERMKAPIKSAVELHKTNLFPDFCGFNEQTGFYSKFIFNQDLGRQLRKQEIDNIIKIKKRNERLEQAIKLYYEEIKFLAQNRPVDVVVCLLSKELYAAVSTEEALEGEERLEESIAVSTELNFRRALKARSMHLGKPLQLLRSESLTSSAKGQQDDATKAWNLASALYYKAGATNPWRLENDAARPQSCALGVAFYRSRDKQTLNTSLAQVFDELGNGLILRGTPVHIDKTDRIPRLTFDQAFSLFKAALEEYWNALRHFPARVVVHKTSNFTDIEIDGFSQAASDLRIDAVDFVTVMDSKIRLFRNGAYPPYRGTVLELSEKKQLLYTRGSIWYYKTYPGLYIPQPLELRVIRSEQSPVFLAREILGLTKMNWNNTQFDGKYPITLSCARKVGEIMKYLDETDHPQIRYGYYM